MTTSERKTAARLAITEWSRPYQPNGLMSLYWRAIPSVLHAAIERGWQYCSTEDPVAALRDMVLNSHGIPKNRGWELGWCRENGEIIAIANSENAEHWYALLDEAGALNWREHPLSEERI